MPIRLNGGGGGGDAAEQLAAAFPGLGRTMAQEILDQCGGSVDTARSHIVQMGWDGDVRPHLPPMPPRPAAPQPGPAPASAAADDADSALGASKLGPAREAWRTPTDRAQLRDPEPVETPRTQLAIDRSLADVGGGGAASGDRWGVKSDPGVVALEAELAGLKAKLEKERRYHEVVQSHNVLREGQQREMEASDARLAQEMQAELDAEVAERARRKEAEQMKGLELARELQEEEEAQQRREAQPLYVRLAGGEVVGIDVPPDATPRHVLALLAERRPPAPRALTLAGAALAADAPLADQGVSAEATLDAARSRWAWSEEHCNDILKREGNATFSSDGTEVRCSYPESYNWRGVRACEPCVPGDRWRVTSTGGGGWESNIIVGVASHALSHSRYCDSFQNDSLVRLVGPHTGAVCPPRGFRTDALPRLTKHPFGVDFELRVDGTLRVGTTAGGEYIFRDLPEGELYPYVLLNATAAVRLEQP